MAGKIFYGTSNTEEGTTEKVVTIISTEENPTLAEGDVLVVLFSDGNTVSSPTMVLQNGSLSNEIATTNDPGIRIRVYSTEEYDLTTAWIGGEAKIFVLTKDNMNVYFFEMLGSIRGNGTIFGNTKIVDETGQQPQGAQDNTALSPLGVKNYVNAQTNLSLDWDSETGSSSGVVLGQLSLQRGEEGSEEPLGDPVTIYYPQSEIQSISKTSDIINDGPKYESQLTATNANNYFGWKKPFLTKFIPNRIYIYGTNNTEDHDNSKIGIYYGVTNGRNIDGGVNDGGMVFVVYSGGNHNVDIYNPHGNSTNEKNGMISLNPAKNGWVRIGEASNYGGKLWVREDAIIQGTLTVQNLTIKGGLNYQGAANFNNKVSLLGKANDGYGLYVEELAKFNKNVDFLRNIFLRESSQILIGSDVLINKDGITIDAIHPTSEINLSKDGLKFGEGNTISKAYRFVFMNTAATAGGRSTGSSSIFANATGVIVTPVVPEADKDIFPGIKDVVLKGVTGQSGVMEIRFINKPGRIISQFAVDVLVIKGNEVEAIYPA